MHDKSLYPIIGNQSKITDSKSHLDPVNNPLPNIKDPKTTFSCSFPLDKVRTFLSKYTSFKEENSESKMKVSRRVLCLYCDRTFVNVNLREKHIERCHSSRHLRRASLRNQQGSCTSSSCTYCDKFVSNEHTLKELFKHLVESHSNKYFGCLICEIRFFNIRHLVEHNGLYHSNKDSTSNLAQSAGKGSAVIPSKKWRLREKTNEPNVVSNSKTLRSKKALVKASRMILKRSKRLQKKVSTFSKKRITGDYPKKSYDVKSNDKNGTRLNGYTHFDNFFQVKKVTDHSIDSLRITSLTFDDVFDKAFFQRIKCNIQENILHHIDGKLFKNEESESRISNFEKSSTVQEPQNFPNEIFGSEFSLNALTPVTLSSSTPLCDDPESQIEYGSKPVKKKLQTKSDTILYKYCTRRKYQASILERKENRDLSKLDIWTQCLIQNRQQKTSTGEKFNEDCLGYVYGDECQNTKKQEELNRILDKRGPFEDLRQEAALDKRERAGTESSFEEIGDLLNDIFSRVFELARETSVLNCNIENVNIKHENNSEITTYLNLGHNSSFTSNQEIDRSDKISLICSSQETEDCDNLHSTAHSKDNKAELTGEWARPRIYVCAACGLKLLNIKQFLEHKSMAHQNVWVQHYEFVGNQSELYTHLSIPVLGKVGFLETTPQCKIWKRSEARSCTKCEKQCNSLGELHRHILECGGDWTWMLVRKKCKYKPFGARARRKRRGLLKRLYTRKTEITDERKTVPKKYVDIPRQKPSDAETIKRMLANLPPKRITRKIINLSDNIKKNKNKNLHPKRRFNNKKINKKTRVKRAEYDKTNNNHRRSLRCLNKVLTNRIIDNSSSIIQQSKKYHPSKEKNKRSKKSQKQNEKSLSVLGQKVPEVNLVKKDKQTKESRRCSLRIKSSLEFQAVSDTPTVKRFFPVKKRNGTLIKSTSTLNEKTAEKNNSTVEPQTEANENETKLYDIIPKEDKKSMIIEDSISPIENEVVIQEEFLDANEKVITQLIDTNENPFPVPEPIVQPNVKKKNTRKSRDLNKCIEMLASKLTFSKDLDLKTEFNVFQSKSYFLLNQPMEGDTVTEEIKTDEDETRNLSAKTGLEAEEKTVDEIVTKKLTDPEDEMPLSSFLPLKDILSEENLNEKNNLVEEFKETSTEDLTIGLDFCDNATLVGEDDYIDILTSEKEIEKLDNLNKNELEMSSDIDNTVVPLLNEKLILVDQVNNVYDDFINKANDAKNVCETNLTQSESMSSIKENLETSLEKLSSPILLEVSNLKTFDVNSTVKEVRRSLRNCKRVTSYNEADLTAPLLEDFESNKTISKLFKESSDGVFLAKKKLSKRNKKLQDQNNETCKKPQDTDNTFPKISDNCNTDDQFESFGTLFDKSIAAIEQCTPTQNDEEIVQESLSGTSDFTKSKEESESKPVFVKSKKQNNKLSPFKRSILNKRKNVEISPDENRQKKTFYCEICNKSFSRAETLNKHKGTITHISKLSELEAKEAALKQNQDTVFSESVQDSEITKSSGGNEENRELCTGLEKQFIENGENLLIKPFIENEESAPNSDSLIKPFIENEESLQNVDFTKPFMVNEEAEPNCELRKSFVSNNGVKLVDIISDVLHRPNLEKSNNLKSFYDYFGNDNIQDSLLSSEKELSYMKTSSPPNLLENQITLLENIIENGSNVKPNDELSVSSTTSPINDFKSDSEHSNLNLPDSNQIEQACEVKSNLEHYFTNPLPNGEHGEDSNTFLDDHKLRKRLNRDEELFLECCSLLKSASEISSFSKVSNLSNDLNKCAKPLLNKPEEVLFENYQDNSNTTSFVEDNILQNSTSENWKRRESFSSDEIEFEKDKGNFQMNVLSFEKIFHSDGEGEKNDDELSIDGGEAISESKSTFNERMKYRKRKKRTIANDKNAKKQILTKGAMKTFEGLKVSIPTEDLNIQNILIPTPPIKPYMEDSEAILKSCPKMQETLSTENNNKSITSLKIDSKGFDIYDFEETQDHSELFSRRDFRSFRNGANRFVENIDGTEDSQEYSNTSTSSVSEIFPKRRKDCHNLTKKKCMIMGRIFKNAFKSKSAEEDSRNVMKNGDLVEDFVVQCSESVIHNKNRMTEEEMNVAFDKLLSSCCDKQPEDMKSDSSNVMRNSFKKRKQKSKIKKKPDDVSGSSDEEFKISANNKKRVRKNPSVNDNCINLEQELRECIGVASRKSQRKCTTGKQNVLIEYWSSDESNCEVAFKTNIVDSLITNYKKSFSKKSKTPKSAPLNTSTTNRRKRANPLYHWSSSSEDEAQDLIEIRPLRDEDDDEDRPMQHGWIVGDSPKKLVTMLAQAKGKKCDTETVKEQGKKRTNTLS